MDRPADAGWTLIDGGSMDASLGQGSYVKLCLDLSNSIESYPVW
ncbi:MAG: hypothetical protein USCAAHI_03091 [Beijerinckiaceae bacterium]|nr:MAG: hypothetical protein USCAAHI_03091 [Beijerinckiaceae bacterium]